MWNGTMQANPTTEAPDDTSFIVAAIETSSNSTANSLTNDRNIGGLPDWGVIYEMISRGITYDEFLRGGGYSASYAPESKRTFLQKLFGIGNN